VLDARRLGLLDARVTVAVDSDATIDAAAKGGMRDVLIDLNIGLPRCGCDPADAGRLADLARQRGLTVRGVMGYEGHAMLLPDRNARASLVDVAGEQLAAAHAAVGGDVVSTGGTGTYDLHTVATEIQAGSYALMDTAYAKLGLPFAEALSIVGTVVSTSTAGYAVADVGLKALGMDHGNSAIDDAKVWFFSDEHVTFAPEHPVRVGDRVRVRPAHVDPTMAYHERAYVVEGERVVDTWLIDLRGW
jgi:D-threonine aldolase